MSNVKDFHMETFSNPYYGFINDFAQSEYENAKLLGKFYTDYNVAEEMIGRVVSEISLHVHKNILRIIDPFCGDGRLILKLLQAISQDKNYETLLIEVYLWDIDEVAVENAKIAVLDFVRHNNINAKIIAEKTDAFVSCFSVEESYDICVTNPPWGLLKPLKLFNSRCGDNELDRYKTSIAAYDDYMRQEFMISQPTSKFGKWGTNLGRCGLEVALRLISADGVCGFVSPASLFNDQVSVPFREWIFNQFSLRSISYFPAELKLYGSADVSSITAVVKTGRTEKIDIRIYDKNFKYCESKLQNADLEYVKDNDYLIPLEFGIESLKLQMQWDSLVSLEEYCATNGLHFVRELDETRLEEKVCSNGVYTFSKGYMVNKYTFVPDNMFVDEKNVEIPKTAQYAKIVWRDVSRNSQKRRVKATLLPENCVAGNSLGAIYSEHNDKELLKVLLAVMNSYVFEFQARKQLVSNHVPVGVVRKIKIPLLSKDRELISLVECKLNGQDVEHDIEVYVAKMYGLKWEEFLNIISTFKEDKKILELLKQKWFA